MGNVIYSLIWLIILIFLGWWAAGIGAFFYIILLPFTVCIQGLTTMGNIIVSLIWLLILIFVSWWVATFAAYFYIFLIPFAVCIEPLQDITDFILKVVQFPKYCTEAMIAG